MLLAAVTRQQGPETYSALLPQLVTSAAEGPMQVSTVLVTVLVAVTVGRTALLGALLLAATAGHVAHRCTNRTNIRQHSTAGVKEP